MMLAAGFAEVLGQLNTLDSVGRATALPVGDPGAFVENVNQLFQARQTEISPPREISPMSRGVQIGKQILSEVDAGMFLPPNEQIADKEPVVQKGTPNRKRPARVAPASPEIAPTPQTPEQAPPSGPSMDIS